MSHIMRTVLTLLLTAFCLIAIAPTADAAPRRTTTLRLEGLSMTMTAKKLRKLKSKVYRVPGVRRARVDLATGELYVVHRGAARVAKKRLVRAARRAGFTVVEGTMHASNTKVRPRG